MYVTQNFPILHYLFISLLYRFLFYKHPLPVQPRFPTTQPACHQLIINSHPLTVTLCLPPTHFTHSPPHSSSVAPLSFLLLLLGVFALPGILTIFPSSSEWVLAGPLDFE